MFDRYEDHADKPVASIVEVTMKTVTSTMRREAKEGRSGGINVEPSQAKRKTYCKALVGNVRYKGKPIAISIFSGAHSPWRKASGHDLGIIVREA